MEVKDIEIEAGVCDWIMMSQDFSAWQDRVAAAVLCFLFSLELSLHQSERENNNIANRGRRVLIVF